MNTSEIIEITQNALDSLDNFEALNTLDPGALAVWELARRNLVSSLACLEDIDKIVQDQ